MFNNKTTNIIKNVLYFVLAICVLVLVGIGLSFAVDHDEIVHTIFIVVICISVAIVIILSCGMMFAEVFMDNTNNNEHQPLLEDIEY
jgi:Na+/proline symporter